MLLNVWKNNIVNIGGNGGEAKLPDFYKLLKVNTIKEG